MHTILTYFTIADPVDESIFVTCDIITAAIDEYRLPFRREVMHIGVLCVVWDITHAFVCTCMCVGAGVWAWAWVCADVRVEVHLSFTISQGHGTRVRLGVYIRADIMWAWVGTQKRGKEAWHKSGTSMWTPVMSSPNVSPAPMTFTSWLLTWYRVEWAAW